jgi:hypothetical protein
VTRDQVIGSRVSYEDVIAARLTGDHLDEVGNVPPYVRPVINDDHHALIRREQPLEVLGAEACISRQRTESVRPEAN